MPEASLPLVTVGILVKNRIWCIRRVLETIENVNYPKRLLKIVFVDDYSTDGTYEIICEWASKAYKKGFYKVNVIRARTNIPQARNLCIKHMEGKYLLFWDSDVIPPLDLLREMVEMMEHNPDVGIMGADYVYEDSTSTRYRPVIGKETNAVYMGFTLIKKEVLEEVRGFNENLSVGEDTEFCIRVKEKTKYRIIWTPKPVLHLKEHKKSKKLRELKIWFWYNFIVRGEEYYVSFKTLPRFLKLRVIYWLLWPWSILFAVFFTLLGNILITLPLLLYVVASLHPVVKQRGFAQGLCTWVKDNVLTGIALSYGVLKASLKQVIMRSNITRSIKSRV